MYEKPFRQKTILEEMVDKLAAESFEQAERLTETRKEQLEQELEQIATLFNTFGRPWFIAGGTALELSQNQLTRDHQDNDIAIYREDAADLYEYLRQKSYAMKDTRQQEITSKEEFVHDRHNAFISQVDAKQSGPKAFEVMFLDKNDQHNIVFADSHLSVPSSWYEQGPVYQTKNNQSIPCTPPEVQLLYKLIDGRQKDFLDIKTFLPHLTSDQRQRLDECMTKLRLSFVIQGQKTQDIVALIQNVETSGTVWKQTAATIESMQAKYEQGAHIMFGLASESTNVEEFLEKIFITFGRPAFEGYEQSVREIATLFFPSKTMSESEFTRRVLNTGATLKELIRNHYLSTPRWTAEYDYASPVTSSEQPTPILPSQNLPSR